MSFNRRGPDRRPDRPDRPDRGRYDRPPQRRPPGDWPPRERGGDRPPLPQRERGGERPYAPRPRFDRGTQDEGGMSIRLDPRRLSTLKQLAAEAGTRPGELVRQWVEERIDAARRGEAPSTNGGMTARIDELTARVAALEGRGAPAAEPAATAVATEPVAADANMDAGAETTAPTEAATGPARRRRARTSASAAPDATRVALHDEIIAVIRELGPTSAADLATAIAERGRYRAPRSEKPLDAAMVNGRVSNPTYRSRFTRSEGRIGLAEGD